MSIPSHKIYASNNTTLIYTIENVIDRDPVLAQTIPDEIEHTNIRSAGAITIPGGNQPYDITITARIAGANYTALMSALESLQNTIKINTNYYLKFDKTLTNDESLESIKVRRKSITVDKGRGHLTKYLYFTIVFRALSWQ